MIEYPVDVASTRWAAYDTTTQEILRRGMRWPRRDGGPIERGDDTVVLLREIIEPQPPFDPDTQQQVRDGHAVDLEASTITYGWLVEELPPEQQDDNHRRRQIKNLYQDLRDGSGTAGERLQRVERVLAYMLREAYGP